MVWLVLDLVGVVAYWVGMVPAIAWALRQRMLQPVCTHCGKTEGESSHVWCGNRLRAENGVPFFLPVPLAPRGSVRARTGADVLHAVRWALLWPYLLLAYGIVRLIRASGAGIARTVPLTAPELERRIREQAAEIARLTAEIDERERS